MHAIHLNPKTMPEEAARLFRQAFPAYRGQHYKIRGVTAVDLRSYWDGGSRDYFTIVCVDGRSLPVPVQSAYDKAVAGADSFIIPDGFAVVEHSIFRGKDLGLTLLVPEQRLAHYLPAETHSLSDEQEVVLYCTATLIPSARRERSGMTRERWDTVKSELVQLGLLRANGSITPEGRNHVKR